MADPSVDTAPPWACACFGVGLRSAECGRCLTCGTLAPWVASVQARSPDKLTEAHDLLRRARTTLAEAPTSSLNVETFDRWRTCWALPQIEEIDAALASAGQPTTGNERT